jgi:hypothetical protein
MNENSKKCRLPKNRTLIRDILIQEWDPIGIKYMKGAPQDEYDAYIDEICTFLLDPGRSQEQVARYLLDIQSKRMRLHGTDAALQRCNQAAQSLMVARLNL